MSSEAEWVLAEREAEDGIHLARMARLPESFSFQENSERIHVIWSYRSGSTDAPSHEDQNEMKEFENAICQKVEAEAWGALVAAFTEPGYREFVFYIRAVERFLQMLGEIPSKNRFPIEILSRGRLAR